MIAVRFTNEAENDVLDIHDYTIETFGLNQWVLYEQGLKAVFENLRTNPLLGTDRSSVKRNVRRILFGSHVIYYRLDLDEIVVMRILHQRQDPGRHL